jgi:hypothetical protein
MVEMGSEPVKSIVRWLLPTSSVPEPVMSRAVTVDPPLLVARWTVPPLMVRDAMLNPVPAVGLPKLTMTLVVAPGTVSVFQLPAVYQLFETAPVQISVGENPARAGTRRAALGEPRPVERS